jgi:hypothetical protein
VLAALFLLVTSLAGFAVLTRVIPEAPTIVRLPGGFLLAIVFTSWTSYAVAWALSGPTGNALTLGVIVSTVLGAGVLWRYGRTLRPKDLRLPVLDGLVAAFAVALSYWLLNTHLREEKGELMVSANTWGDMALHLGLSRSFSVGANYPTEYPFFAGEPIHYHFGFDFFAGALQRGGASPLWSFNGPAIIGLSAVMLLTFAIARMLFSSAAEPVRWWRDRGVWAGFVAIALVVTNQSLAWLRYVDKDGKGDLATALRPSVLWNHKDYLTVGPYTDDPIAIFNTFNPFLGQNHLIIAMALVLLAAYVLIDRLKGDGRPSTRLLIGMGITFGAAFWINGVVWLAAAVFIAALLILWALAARRRAVRADDGGTLAGLRESGAWIRIGAAFAVPALALGVPQALALSGGSGAGLGFHLGYLVCASTQSSCHGGDMNPLALADWWSFAKYWWLNEGVFIPLLVVAFIIGSARDRRIIAAVTAIFVWGSLFAVGEDIGGFNHKVFNLWEILAGPFAAFALIAIFTAGRRLAGRALPIRAGASVASGLVAAALFVLLVVSGIVDFMTVKNDTRVGVFGDEVQRQATTWIINETESRATFLIDFDQMYNAPTLSGRRVALGYSPWAASSGYDVEPRKQVVIGIYTAPDLPAACRLLSGNDIGYMLIGPQERTSTRFKVNDAVFSQLVPAAIFGADANQYRIYRVADIC